jgi:peptidoglycan/LPS O-acetylase OafA/YrhL
MPNYYLFVLVNAILSATGIGVGLFSYEFILFSQNLAWPEQQPLFFGEAWSLALDEWFYFLMPLLVGLASRVLNVKPRTAFLLVAMVLIIFPAVARFFMVPPESFLQWDASVRRVTVFHLDATGWGVLSAIASRWAPHYWLVNRRIKAILGVLLTTLGVLMMESLLFDGWSGALLPRVSNVATLTLPAAGAFLLLPWLAGLPPFHKAISWVIDRISLYSYSLYLCHIPVIHVVQACFAVDANTSLPVLLIASATWLVGTFTLSVLVFRYFENPTSKLRERYTRKVSASPFESSSPVQTPMAK